jgi:hypothetical protein
MQKQLCLDLDSLMEQYPTSEYDISGRGHEITIDLKDKADFIKEITRQFKERIMDLLELEYVCESCETPHTDSCHVYKCENCKDEICSCCEELDGLCKDCVDF